MLGSKREQRVLSGALRRVSRSEALWDHLRCAHSETTGEDHELPWPNARMSSAARASQMTELASAGYIRDGPGGERWFTAAHLLAQLSDSRPWDDDRARQPQRHRRQQQLHQTRAPTGSRVVARKTPLRRRWSTSLTGGRDPDVSATPPRPPCAKPRGCRPSAPQRRKAR